MSTPKIIALTPEKYRELGCPCFLNPKQEGHILKQDWLKERLLRASRLSTLFLEGQKNPTALLNTPMARMLGAPCLQRGTCLFIASG